MRSNDVPQDSEGESVGSVDLLENVIALFATCTAKCSTFPQKDGNDILRLAKAIHVVIGDTEGVGLIKEKSPVEIMFKFKYFLKP